MVGAFTTTQLKNFCDKFFFLVNSNPAVQTRKCWQYLQTQDEQITLIDQIIPANVVGA